MEGKIMEKKRRKMEGKRKQNVARRRWKKESREGCNTFALFRLYFSFLSLTLFSP
jgi:hypothetical protein